MKEPLNRITALKILHLLSEGNKQKEVQKLLEAANISPYSLRTIEDYIKRLKELNNCKNIERLMFKYGRRHKIRTN